MRKILLALAAAASMQAVNAQTVFSTTLSTQDEFDQWTVIDNNNDGWTWLFDASQNEGMRTYYSYHSTNAADDWLISPAITPSQSGQVLVKYSYVGSSYGENMEVFWANAPEIAALQANMMKSYENLPYEQQSDYFLMNFEAGETYYLGFHASSKADMYRLYLSRVEVEFASSLVDLSLDEISDPVSGENLGQEYIALTVSNAAGMDTAEEYSITVSLDGKEMFTETINQPLAGGESAFIVLSTPVDLSVSHRTYTIEATVNVDGDINTSNNSCTVKVRHEGAAVEPYFMGFETDEDVEGHAYFNLNGDTGDWGISYGSYWSTFARTGNACLGYNYDSSNAADDWAILEGVQVGAGYHVLKFWYSGDSNYVEKFKVCYGTQQTPEAMVNELADFPNVNNGSYQEAICIFETAEAQTIYIGFYCYSDADQNWLTIDDITLESIDPAESDISINTLSEPLEFYSQKWYDRVIFELYNLGVNSADVDVTIAIDGVNCYSASVTLQGQEKSDYTVENLLRSLSVGTHTLRIEATLDNDPNTENNVVEKQIRVLGTPDIAYDFEDGEVPEDFTFRNEGTSAHPSAADEWGELGWAPFEIENHDLFGNYWLGGNTWLTSSTSKADIWCVLPQMHVGSSDACMTWAAMGLNALYTEAYNVEISTDEDAWYYYSTVFQESSLFMPSCGAVDLSSYAGKDVYIAFHVRSLNGDAIAFDNIELYGVTSTSGIENVSVESAREIQEVFDLNGRSLGKRLESLPQGIYLIRYTDGTARKAIR
ncbi:MAG: choice-of-anchor J domain-containing protein [Bacteroidales bacterium]|nr:choice-of-anchor J domain-containing protein [Bacteroidales bacterium]